MMCTRCTTPNAGPRCRCWLSMCRPARGWCLPGGTSRRCGSRGCAPRAGSWRSARVTCRSPAPRLLRDAEVAVGEDEVAELHRRTEGWPAGLYLAALYLKEGGPLASAAFSFGGD